MFERLFQAEARIGHGETWALFVLYGLSPNGGGWEAPERVPISHVDRRIFAALFFDF